MAGTDTVAAYGTNHFRLRCAAMTSGSVKTPDPVTLDQVVYLRLKLLEVCKRIRIFRCGRKLIHDQGKSRKVCVGPSSGSDRQSQCIIPIQFLSKNMEGPAEGPDFKKYVCDHQFHAAIAGAPSAKQSSNLQNSLRSRCASCPLISSGGRPVDNTLGVFAGLAAQCISRQAADRLLDGFEHNGMPEVRHG